jgi:hypothetical protein
MNFARENIDFALMHKDMSDIRMILENNYPKIDLKLVREYFSLFNREKELDELIKDINNA